MSSLGTLLATKDLSVLIADSKDAQGVLWYFHTYVGLGYFSKFWISIFWGVFRKMNIFWGYEDFMVICWGHHEIGLVKGHFYAI